MVLFSILSTQLCLVVRSVKSCTVKKCCCILPVLSLWLESGCLLYILALLSLWMESGCLLYILPVLSLWIESGCLFYMQCVLCCHCAARYFATVSLGPARLMEHTQHTHHVMGACGAHIGLCMGLCKINLLSTYSNQFCKNIN